MHAMTHRTAGTGPTRAARGFTVIELLVVAGMIILLASILIVAVNAAVRTSQKASTVSLMNAIKTGLAQFQGDVGYLPPVLDDRRKLATLPDPGDPVNFVSDVQDWFSVSTLADFLVGYGHHGQDGYGYDAVDAATWTQETPPVGIRNPGPDGLWGATSIDNDGNGMFGDLADRMASATNPNLDTGRVYGPYIELQDERLLGRLDPATGEISFPGEAGFDAAPDATNPRVLVICDYWGKPIRYYRRVHSPGALTVDDRRSKLSEVILLRPFDAKQENIVLDARSVDGSDIDLTTYQLQTGEFALFSSGADRELNPELRVDDPQDPLNTLGTDLVNADNIVEVGP